MITRLKKPVGIVLLVLPVLFLLADGISKSRAALIDYQIDQWLAHWSEQRQKTRDVVLDANEVLMVYELAESAAVLQPLNGNAMLKRGIVADWYVMQGDESSKLHPHFAGVALSSFRTATVIKPFESDSYFKLAYALARQNQLQDEFERSIQTALILGAWNEGLQQRIAQLGLQLRSYVSSAANRRFDQNLRRMSVHQPIELMKIAKQLDKKQHVCAFFDSAEQVSCMND
ncbi:Uncharacterised protein [BD1-7 clade bacterium]|uniref:Uncharacterized protein n=1 Tax=BD1-7 clade bacterium TaxID=2029982 RepID=A0A5S9QPZ1_9GAMM|nr:Uncharacterised protein [BD1-7 clade bacterium]CAA0121517.1 Uncharacterised protein [BD1-7 clade bacterium]